MSNADTLVGIGPEGEIGSSDFRIAKLEEANTLESEFLNPEVVETLHQRVVDSAVVSIEQRTRANQQCYLYVPISGSIPLTMEITQRLEDSGYNPDKFGIRYVVEIDGETRILEVNEGDEDSETTIAKLPRGSDLWEFSDQGDGSFHILVDDIVDTGSVVKKFHTFGQQIDQEAVAITPLIKASGMNPDGTRKLSTIEHLGNHGIPAQQITSLAEQPQQLSNTEGDFLFYGAVGENSWYYSGFGMNSDIDFSDIDFSYIDMRMKAELIVLERMAQAVITIDRIRDLDEYRRILENFCSIPPNMDHPIFRNFVRLIMDFESDTYVDDINQRFFQRASKVDNLINLNIGLNQGADVAAD